MVCFEIGGMLICVFLLLQQITSPSVHYDASHIWLWFSYLSFSPVYSTHLALHFTWDRVSIPRNWIFISWRDQPEYHDFVEIIATSTPMLLKPPFLCHLFVFWALAFDHLEKFTKVLALWLLLKILFYLLKLFCHPEQHGFQQVLNLFIALWRGFSSAAVEWMNQIWYWGLQEAPQGISQRQRNTLHVPCWSPFISPMQTFPPPHLLHTVEGWGLLSGLFTE